MVAYPWLFDPFIIFRHCPPLYSQVAGKGSSRKPDTQAGRWSPHTPKLMEPQELFCPTQSLAMLIRSSA
jgi:hypothetical protein